MKRIVVLFYAVMLFFLACGFSWNKLFFFNYNRTSATTSAPVTGLPVMGWNSAYFDWNIHPTLTPFVAGLTWDETTIQETINAIAAPTPGYKAAGYEYVCLDDGWVNSSRVGGLLVAHPTRVPSGIAPLAAYAHSGGLKFGLYYDRGTLTCGTVSPGSFGYEAVDAQTFADWGVDFAKGDNCSVQATQTPQVDYTLMRNSLDATGRDFHLNICMWEYEDWMPSVGNSWRIEADYDGYWSVPAQAWSAATLNLISAGTTYASSATIGHWNDMDLLQIGSGNQTGNEDQTTFAMWCMLNSPLILSFDVRSAPASVTDIVLNTELIALNQDQLGQPASMLTGNWETGTGPFIYKKNLYNGDTAVALLNITAGDAPITVTWGQLGFSGYFTFRDLVAKTDEGSFINSYAVTVASHAVSVYRCAWAAGTPTPTATVTCEPSWTPGPCGNQPLDPSSLSPGLDIWAPDYDAVFDNGTSVAGITEVSANAISFGQAVTAYWPVFVKDAINGRSVFRMTGNQHWVSGSVDPISTAMGSNDLSLIVVSKVRAGDCAVFGVPQNGNDNEIGIFTKTVGGPAMFDIGAGWPVLTGRTNSTSTASNDWHTWEIHLTGAAYEIFLDGVSDKTGNFGVTTGFVNTGSSAIYVGSWTGSTYFFGSDLLGLWSFKTRLTAVERERVYQWIKAQTGL